jgi:membrane associated rhomboid family serine protease
MSLYDRDYIRQTRRSQAIPGPKSVVGWLIAINVAIFFADVFLFNGGLRLWMAVERITVPAAANTLFEPLQWWRFVTYGFAHAGPGLQHILGNMIVLFFFGRQIEADYGPKKFLAFYLTAVIVGGVGASVRHTLMDSEFRVIGASGAGFAIIILFALRHPNATVNWMMVIPIRAWIFGVAYMLIEVFAMRHPGDMVAHDVHVIGGIYGFIFFKTAWDVTQVTPKALAELFRSGRVSIPKRGPRVKLYDPEAKSQKLDAEADRILAKLHHEGETSLTAKERKTLEQYSRRMQQKRR